MRSQRLILRVNLSKGKISREPVIQELRHKYLGGEGINSRLLWEYFLKVDPNIDPLSQDNVLIAGCGPLSGTGFGAGSKMKFTYKSPAYKLFGDTSVGGGLAAQLRWAGYDHVVITGKAKTPVYLWINDDLVEIRDASHLWGRGVHEVDAAIKQELHDTEVETACIGQAGENMVRVASIIASCHRAGGRGGGGCVFGSKNLKAIAARGTKGLNIYNPKAFFQTIDDFLKVRTPGSMEHILRYGSLEYVRILNSMGFSNYRNAQCHLIPDEGVGKIDHNWYTNNIGVRTTACSPGCVFGCNHWYYIKGDESPAAKVYAGEWGTRPEFGAVNPIGIGCDIMDLPAVVHFNKMCNNYGMDTMEIGGSISLLMELWDRGIINSSDTNRWAGEPLSLDWGNFKSVERVIEAIALQKNELGEILRGGVYQTALKINELKGVDALKYGSYGKGGSAHSGVARAWPGLTLSCALASFGAQHTKGHGISHGASVMYFGKPDAANMLGATLKGAGHAVSENLTAIPNSLGACTMLIGSDPDRVPLELITRALDSAAGIRLTTQELYTAGERIVNIQKSFNSRLGLRREHDTVCERWMTEPVPAGAAKGRKVSDYLEAAKDEYYQWRGWDPATSLQTKKKLEELDMLDVAQVLEEENALV